jgi:hypothetical protein
MQSKDALWYSQIPSIWPSNEPLESSTHYHTLLKITVILSSTPGLISGVAWHLHNFRLNNFFNFFPPQRAKFPSYVIGLFQPISACISLYQPISTCISLYQPISAWYYKAESREHWTPHHTVTSVLLLSQLPRASVCILDIDGFYPYTISTGWSETMPLSTWADAQSS